MKKVFSIVMIAVMLLASVSNVVLANNVTSGVIKPGDIQIDPGDVTGVTTLGGKIIGFIQTFGTIAAVAILAVLGVKYMVGSAEEKAEYKKTFIPYIVGAILLAGATNIAGWIFQWTTSI